MLAHEAVEVVDGLLLDIGLAVDGAEDLGEVGIAGPDLHGGLDLGLDSGLVAAHGGALRLGQVHRADGLGRLDGGQGLGGVEVGRHRLQVVGELFGQGVILHVDRREELVLLLGEGEGLPLLVPGEVADVGHVFAQDEGLAEPLAGAGQLLFVEEEEVGVDPLLHVAHRLVGQRVEDAQGGGHSGRLGEHVLGVLAEMEGGVAVPEEVTVEEVSHQHVLEAALHEELDHEALELDLRLHDGGLPLDLVRRHHRVDLGQPLGDGEKLHVPDLFLVLEPGALDRLVVLRAGLAGIVEIVVEVLGGPLGVPLEVPPLGVEGLLGVVETVPLVVREPGGVDPRWPGRRRGGRRSGNWRPCGEESRRRPGWWACRWRD